MDKVNALMTGNDYRDSPGNLMTTRGVDAVVQQCNCLTVKPHGLSVAIAQKHPWANPYSLRRVLGKRNLAVQGDLSVLSTIHIMKSPDPGIPDVIIFYVQWDFGRCQGKVIPTYEDTYHPREVLFQQCLKTRNFKTILTYSSSLPNWVWFSLGN